MKERERQQVLDRLTSGRDRLLGLVEGLTSEQWSYRPAEGRWSTGECLEHVTIVEKRVIGIITGKIAEGAPASEKTAQEHLDDEALVAGVLDRSVRLQAPEPVLPGGKWTHPKDLIEDFGATRQRTIDFASTTESDLRSYFHPHPFLGKLDCYQWLVAASLHGSRHAQQMEEIKKSKTFPRKSEAAQV